MKRLILSFGLTFFLFSLWATKGDSIDNHLRWNPQHLSFTAAYQYGPVAPTNVFVRGSNQNSVVIDDFQALNLKFGTRTSGMHEQEQLLNYPEYGIGLKVLDFHNPSEIGIPLALYGYLDIPLLRLNRFALRAETGFGLSFNWRSFNPITNQFNVALGLGQAFMSDAGMHLAYAVSDHWELFAGINFTHYSNGAIKLPNFGINAYAPKVGMKYNLNGAVPEIRHELPKFKQHGEWIISAFAAMKNVIFDSVNIDIQEKYEGVFFPVYGVSALYQWALNPFIRLGVGSTFDFNESVNAQIAVINNELTDIDGPVTDYLQWSIYPSFQFGLDRMSLTLQPAFYLARKNFQGISPVFHQRISIKYQINDHLQAGITLRDYNMHADFVEWTLGWKI